MIALIAALPEETQPLRKDLAATRRMRWAGAHVWEGRYAGRDVLLVRSGAGKERAERAAGDILKHYPVSAVVSFGFGGGACRELAAGELVVCPQVFGLEEGPGLQNLLAPRPASAGLLQRATGLLNASGAPGRLGAGLTVTASVSSPERKARLGEHYGAQVLDMESYWVAGLAQERGVPFLSVRAIVDPQEQRLPRRLDLLEAGGWRRRWGAVSSLSRPVEVICLLRLWANARVAGRNLNLFLRRFVAGGVS